MKAIEQNIEKEIAQAVMEEQPMQPPAPKRKKRLTESTAAKVIAFLLMLVMTAVTAGGVLGAVFLYSTDVYVTSETAFKQELFSNIAWGDGQMLLNFLIWNSEEQVYQMNTEAADSYCAERNISYVMVQDKTGRELWYTGLAEYDSPWQFRFSYDWANPERPSAGVVENAYTVRITVPLSSVFVYDDDYALANRLAELAYALRYWIYAIIAAAALLVTVCFIFLLCAAGHHPYVDGVRPGWGTRIPLDLLTAAVALMIYTASPCRLIEKYGSISITAQGMLIGGLALGLLLRIWQIPGTYTPQALLGTAAITLIGTVLGFTIYLKSTVLIGPLKAGLIAAVETVSAPFFSRVWLKTPFQPVDYWGFLCILSMVFLISLPELRKERAQAPQNS